MMVVLVMVSGAPFPPSTGESQETALAAAWSCANLLKGRDAAQWRILSQLMHSIFYAQTTVCAGMEMALLDALTRSYGMPLYGSFWWHQLFCRNRYEHSSGHARSCLRTGARNSCTWRHKRIKVKVGHDLREDVDRVEAIRNGAPHLGLTLDA